VLGAGTYPFGFSEWKVTRSMIWIIRLVAPIVQMDMLYGHLVVIYIVICRAVKYFRLNVKS
jgi:hypothetical protein